MTKLLVHNDKFINMNKSQFKQKLKEIVDNQSKLSLKDNDVIVRNSIRNLNGFIKVPNNFNIGQGTFEKNIDSLVQNFEFHESKKSINKQTPFEYEDDIKVIEIDVLA